MLRSVLAVVAGYFAMAVVVVASTALAAAILLGAMPSEANLPPLTAGYVAANLACGAVAAILGGFVAARIARRKPLSYAVALALLVAVLGGASLLLESGRQPRGYGLALIFVGPIGVIVGGWLASLGEAGKTARTATP